jgi:hypothetical protein
VNLVEQLVLLAEEIETADPIDWGMLEIDEHDAYTLMATGVLDNYLSMAPDDRDMAMLSIVVKLTVENFVLNLKLANAGKAGNT